MEKDTIHLDILKNLEDHIVGTKAGYNYYKSASEFKERIQEYKLTDLTGKNAIDENGNPIMQEENTISEGDTGFKELSSSNKGNIVSKNISNFKTSAIKNNGYYIGRYEARTNTARNSENNQLTQMV